MMMPLGPFGVVLGMVALPVMGVFVYVGIGFHAPPVKSVADKFLVFTHCLSGFWLVGIGSVRICAFWCGWCGCSVGGVAVLWLAWALWGIFLVYCVLCCV